MASGKRSLVSHLIRTTPISKRGLAQIDAATQAAALHSKWVVRALSRPTRPWVTYWRDSEKAIKQYFQTGRTGLAVLFAINEPTAEAIGECIESYVGRFGVPCTLLSDDAAYFKDDALRSVITLVHTVPQAWACWTGFIVHWDVH